MTSLASFGTAVNEKFQGLGTSTQVITGGWVLDPGRWNGLGDVWIHQGRIMAVVPPGRPALSEALCIDATGLLVVPGLVDLHVHLREPGFEYKETIATGTAAAVAGGFPTVCCMPNTRPVNDEAAVTGLIRRKAAEAGLATVYPIGAITRGSEGRDLTDFLALKEAGCVALSDDGRPVMDAGVMRRAMEQACEANMPIINHCEDLSLSGCGCMNDGPVARALGVRGMPPEAESRMVERDLKLAQETGCHLHVAHISTANAVQAVRRAKAKGVCVTAEASPHHIFLTDDVVRTSSARAKMNPPLRRPEDLQTVREGLRDGTIDAIATDHAPHAEYEKAWGMDRAPFGIVGLETALALTLRLVEEKVLSLESAVRCVTSRPARAFGLPGGSLAVGAAADLVVVDRGREWIVDPEQFHSKGRNTPFAGWRLRGQVVMTIVGGRVVYQRLADA
jgi:dihydroorotase